MLSWDRKLIAVTLVQLAQWSGHRVAEAYGFRSIGLAGALMQSHIHDDLCHADDPEQPRTAGPTSCDGMCPSGPEKHKPAPMIHVWITPQKCGSFASLEGTGAGQILAGQERLFDHQQGGGS